MGKRRIRLVINGVVCGLKTEESDEYMQSVSDDVGSMMKQILDASPFITREAAALTVALNYCDESKKGDARLLEMRQRVSEMEKRMLEAERKSVALKKENSQLWEETGALMERDDEIDEIEARKYEARIAELEAENQLLNQRIGNSQNESGNGEEPGGMVSFSTPPISLKNPLRHNDHEQQGFVSFFAKDADEKADKNIETDGENE